MKHITINGDRLWQSLMTMAKIGATEKGGCCRLTLTDLDKEARDLFVQWCEEAGCTVTVDQVGNIFARRPGRHNDLPPIMTGSHLDTQPTGGKFDGVFGVLAGLEVLRTLQDHNVETKAPVEVSVWTNEEGSRFAPAMMGSGVVAGRFTLEEILAKTDIDGKLFGEELKRIGYAGELPARQRPIGAFFEAHIEQGPYLEAEKKTIGVVNKGQGQRWYDVTITGRESHAGTTPMPLRHDALAAAARLINQVERIANTNQPHACGTVGFLQVHPNSRNTIPGQVTMSVDLRHPDDTILSKMDRELKVFCEHLPAEVNVEVKLEPIWYYAPVIFSEQCINAVREGARTHGYSHMDIFAGAGHDACYIADFAPASMIFIPCENGISHNEIENAEAADIIAGCNVLLSAMLERANA
ncbi:MAG: Zn-dependent hydrolase [Deltaproteobacteria bacterium]|nr:Zn-dependent hydrolase [Deltaproteobacteria bacterium]